MKLKTPSRVIPEVWYNDFATHYISDSKLYDFITNVEIGVNTYNNDGLHLLYITLYVSLEQFEWLKESEILMDMKKTIKSMTADTLSKYDLNFCLFRV